MRFTFKRDEEGHERIYVGDVCVARMREFPEFEVTGDIVRTTMMRPLSMVSDAIERADEAGFWEPEKVSYSFASGLIATRCVQVTVDVPVAETSTTLTLVGEEGDEA